MVDLSNTFVFDIECRMSRKPKPNFYQKADKFLCLVAQNVVTNEVKVFLPDQLGEMIDFLGSVDYLCGHNIKDFDIPVLGHLIPQYKDFFKSIPLIDSRWMAYYDKQKSPHGLYSYGRLRNYDKKMGHPKTKALNSLKAWGYRFGDNKLDTYANYTDDDWANLQLTEELVEYCIQDVSLNTKLFLFLLTQKGMEYNAEVEQDMANWPDKI